MYHCEVPNSQISHPVSGNCQNFCSSERFRFTCHVHVRGQSSIDEPVFPHFPSKVEQHTHRLAAITENCRDTTGRPTSGLARWICMNLFCLRPPTPKKVAWSFPHSFISGSWTNIGSWINSFRSIWGPVCSGSLASDQPGQRRRGSCSGQLAGTERSPVRDV